MMNRSLSFALTGCLVLVIFSGTGAAVDCSGAVDEASCTAKDKTCKFTDAVAESCGVLATAPTCTTTTAMCPDGCKVKTGGVCAVQTGKTDATCTGLKKKDTCEANANCEWKEMCEAMVATDCVLPSCPATGCKKTDATVATCLDPATAPVATAESTTAATGGAASGESSTKAAENDDKGSATALQIIAATLLFIHM